MNLHEDNLPVISESIKTRMQSGEALDLSLPEFSVIWFYIERTLSLNPALNASTSTGQMRAMLSSIIGAQIDESTILFAPFHTNFGRYISIGKNVFINHGCSFLDLGSITIDDNVLIGPKVNLITENHPLDPTQRNKIMCSPIVIKKNAWIGAAATILPGVTIGENAVVAAGAVVHKDVQANTVVGGVPAKLLKDINS